MQPGQLTQILSNAQSGDGNLRMQAEQALKQLETNLGLFLHSLSQELSDEQKPVGTRRLAGIMIKNALLAQSEALASQRAQRWLQLDAGNRGAIKNLLIAALQSPVREVRLSGAQATAAVAVVELPEGQWTDCVQGLVNFVSPQQNNPFVKEGALHALGYICEDIDPRVLGAATNSILTAVVTGMGPNEKDNNVRLAALTAMLNAVEFVRGNMEAGNERSYIFQVVCGNTQFPVKEVRVKAFQILVELGSLYYDKLVDFIQDLFNLTLRAIKTDDDEVAQQAIEFWSTVTDRELDQAIEIQEYGQSALPNHNFIRGALQYLIPVLLETLTKQDEDPESEEWNAQKAAGSALKLIAALVRNDIVPQVMPFVTSNINNSQWRLREAAVLAFGSILEGPESEFLAPLINQAMPILVNHMKDPEQIVRDTTAWTIGTICVEHPEQAKPHLHVLMVTLIEHVDEPSNVALQVCFAINSLAEAFEPDAMNAQSPMSKYFTGVVQKLMARADREITGDDPNLRASLYEAINGMIKAAAKDQQPKVLSLAPVFLEKLEHTFSMADKSLAADIQALLCGVLLNITNRVGSEIKKYSDSMMRRYFHVFESESGRVHEEALLAIGSIATALGSQFDRYAMHFGPYLFRCLDNVHDQYVCSVAIAIVSDMANALEGKFVPLADKLMTVLLQNLQNPELSRDVKPQILSCFGDIALAVGGDFEKYFQSVMGMLKQASMTNVTDPTDLDSVDYVNSLRGAVFEAYSTILQGLRGAKKQDVFMPYLGHMVSFIEHIAQEPMLPMSVRRGAIGLVGDIAVALPLPAKNYLVNDRMQRFLSDSKANANDPGLVADAEWALGHLHALVR